jgi:hypothetical protein
MPKMTDAELAAERRERQQVWSLWLDEHYGPGTNGLDLSLGDDREELAALLSRAVERDPLAGLWPLWLEGRRRVRRPQPAEECCWSRCEDCGATCADFDDDGWCHVGEASCGCILCDVCTNRHDNEDDHGSTYDDETAAKST